MNKDAISKGHFSGHCNNMTISVEEYNRITENSKELERKNKELKELLLDTLSRLSKNEVVEILVGRL